MSETETLERPVPEATPIPTEYDAGEFKFVQGDAEWHRLRELFKTDLFWAASVVLNFGEQVPVREHAHRALCRIIEGRTGCPEIDERHIVKLELPRDWGKSSLLTRAHPIQLIAQNPNISILIFNEVEQNAKDFLAAIQWHFESNDLFRALFPELIPKDFLTDWSASRMCVPRTTGRSEPTVFVGGVGGTKTGMHPDVIIVDDMISREAMENARAGSWQLMHQVNRWINQLPPLISKQYKRWRIYFMGTRWWHGDSYEHVDKAFGYGETPRVFNLRIPLPDGTVQVLPVTVTGDLVAFKRAAIENGRSSFPEKWTLEDLAKLRLRDEALFACLPAGESVLTHDGQKRIEEVAVGDQLLTKEGRYEPVVALGKRHFAGDLVTIYGWGQGVPVRVTPNHRVWTTRGWVCAADLTTDDVLSTPLRPGIVDSRSTDFWFLVGHFIGDGTVNSRGVVAHCFNKKDRALAERIASIVQRLWKRKARIEEARTVLRVTYSHPEVAAFFSELSHGSAQKWLPAQYEAVSSDCLDALVQGYYAADGCVVEHGITATSVCHRWLCQLQRILAALGRIAYVSKGKPNTTSIEGRTVKAQRLYQLWEYAGTARRRKSWIANGTLYRRVRKIEHEAFSGFVYNCEVKEDHSYVSANNTLTYANCNYMNQPSDERTATFKEGWLRYYEWVNETQLTYTDQVGKRVVCELDDFDVLFFVDPGGFAARQIEDRARPAVAVVGDDRKGQYVIFDIYNENDTFLACIDTICAWITRYEPRKIIVENAGQQIAFIKVLRDEIAKRGLSTVVEEIKTGGRQKEVRILGLEPYFQRGQFLVGKGPNFHTFREQYTQFPRTARVDVLDVLAYLPQFMRRGTGTKRSHAQRQQSELATYKARRGIA